MREVLRSRDFRLLWLAGLISMIGDWALVAALPFEVFRRTGSTLATAGVVLSSIAPQLLFGSAAGVLADRWDRRRLMVWVSVAQAIVLLPLLLVDGFGIWIVYIVLFAATALDQLFIPAEVAMLPRLVAEDQLVAANSLSSLNRNMARLIGPAIGAIAVAAGGLGLVVAVDSASFLATAILILLIAPHASFRAVQSAQDRAAAGATAVGRLVFEWRDGFSQAWSSLALRGLLLFTLITAIGEGVTSALFVPWVSVALHGDNAVYALLLSTQAIGGIIGAFVVARFLRNAAPGMLLAIGAIVFGLIDLVLFTYPLLAPIVWPAVVGMVIVGVPTAAMGVGATTMQQTETADTHRGRVVGLMMTVGAAGIVFGNLLGGIFGSSIGIVQLLILQGSGYTIGGLIVLYVTRRIRQRALTEPNALLVEPGTHFVADP
jgi:Na+/melibiose symporter-like transporter